MGECVEVEPLMTVDEVAAWLRKHQDQIYDMAASGELPAMRIGRTWRFDRRDIERWLREKVEPKREHQD